MGWLSRASPLGEAMALTMQPVKQGRPAASAAAGWPCHTPEERARLVEWRVRFDLARGAFALWQGYACDSREATRVAAADLAVDLSRPIARVTVVQVSA